MSPSAPCTTSPVASCARTEGMPDQPPPGPPPIRRTANHPPPVPYRNQDEDPMPQSRPIRYTSEQEKEDDEFAGACLKVIAAGLIIVAAIGGIVTTFVLAIIWAWRHL